MKTIWDFLSEDSDYSKSEKIDYVDGKRITLTSQREFFINNIEGGYTLDKKDSKVTITKDNSSFELSFKDFLAKNWPKD